MKKLHMWQLVSTGSSHYAKKWGVPLAPPLKVLFPSESSDYSRLGTHKLIPQVSRFFSNA